MSFCLGSCKFLSMETTCLLFYTHVKGLSCKCDKTKAIQGYHTAYEAPKGCAFLLSIAFLDKKEEEILVWHALLGH